MKSILICDIDGTLTVAENKEKPGSRGYYDWDRVGEDEPNLPTIYVIRRILGGKRLVLVTGRKEVAREGTDRWLSVNLRDANNMPIQYLLFMRDNDDNSSAVEFKENVYKEYIKGIYDPFMSIDDDPATSKMWADCGIPTLQVLPYA